MIRSFRSPLTAMLREAQAAAMEADRTGAPIDEVGETRAERRAARARARWGRREVLAGAGALAASSPAALSLALASPAALSLALAPSRSRAVGAPKIVIVGAGLAGLACAQRLWTGAGLASTIYEGSNGVGGRVRTLRGFFAGDEVAELHGEFISSEHLRMRRLARLYGLELVNVNATLGDAKDTAFFGGARYNQASLNRAWQEGAWKLFRDAAKEASVANFRRATPKARAWDQMSVIDWIERHVPGGVAGDLGQLCIGDVLSEYGGPPEGQSALNLIYVLGLDASAADGLQSPRLPLLAGTDEKHTVRGGNDRIVKGLVGELPAGAIRTGHRLAAVRESGAGFACAFETGAGTLDVSADHVVLAIPPTTLREVDLSGVALSALKRTQIEELHLGSNAKILIQVAGRPWQADGFSGAQFTDRWIGGGWDASCFQPGSQGADPVSLYAAFPGGAAGAGLAGRYGLTASEGPAPAALVGDALDQLEPIFSGMEAAWAAGPKRAYYRDGNLDPLLRGAYSYYRVGQFTLFSGIEAERAGNLHFAGEHTCPRFQGYMEGAVESGWRAAGEITG